MDQATFPFILTDPAGRKHECEYVFDLDEDGQPTSCQLWMHDHCIDGEVWGYIPIWRAFKKDEADRAAEAGAWDRRAA